MKTLLTLLLGFSLFNCLSQNTNTDSAYTETIKDSVLTAVVTPSAKIRLAPVSDSELLIQFATSDTVIILDFVGDGYYKVQFDTIVGFMNEMWLKYPSTMATYKKSKTDFMAKNYEYETEQYYIDKWGQETYNRLKLGSMWLGMTSEMFRFSFGNPDHVNSSKNQYGTYDQWVYPTGEYYYFENGKLVSIQD